MKCCLCGKEFHGFGNNPCGAINKDLTIRQFNITDSCCNDCNMNEVIKGRLIISKAKEIFNRLNQENREHLISQIKELTEKNEISAGMQAFMIKNLDILKK